MRQEIQYSLCRYKQHSTYSSYTTTDWADLVVFVNRNNYNTACANFDQQEFDYKYKVLDIPDQYPHMHPLLIKQFRKQFESTTKVKELV